MASTITPNTRRNVALVGHLHVGKTLLGESLLFKAGAVTRIGHTEDGTSHFDFEKEEVEHQSTLKDAAFDLRFGDFSITILDTPGSSDFIADTQAAVRAADSVVLVVGASSGLKVQGEKAWNLAVNEKIARAIFVNEMDKPQVSFESTLQLISETLHIQPVALTVPLSTHACIDVLSNTVYETDPGAKTSQRAAKKNEIDLTAGYRTRLVEAVAETEDQLMAEYFEKGALSEESLRQGFRTAFARGVIVPVFVGSALTQFGTLALLEGIVSYFPSPLDRGPYYLTGERPQVLEVNADKPFAGLIFKTFTDPFTGQVSLVRVIRGTLSSDAEVINPRTEQKERVGKLHLQHGKEYEVTDKAVAGQIVGIAKLKNSHTGDTLCSEQDLVQLRGFAFPAPTISFAVQPKTRRDEDKILAAIQSIHEEDPAIDVHRDGSTHEMLVSGLSQSHVEIALERIERKFHVEGVLQEPKVPYRETISIQVEAQGRHKKQTGGHGQFGDCWLRLAPLPRGSGFVFKNEVFGGAIPRNYIPAVEKGVIETLEKGYLGGYPIVDVECTVYDGSYHPVDSSELSFKLAAAKALKACLAKARPVFLEPMMKTTIEVPDDYVGSVIGHLNSKRGRVVDTESKGKISVIRAMTPLAEMLSYASALRAISADRGSFEIEFSGYEEVPVHLTQRLVKAHKEEDEEAHHPA